MRFRPGADVGPAGAQYLGRVAADALRRIVPLFAVAVAVAAAITDPSSAGQVILIAIPPAAFVAWTYLPRLPLVLVAVAVVMPVVLVQRHGTHEAIMFEASLLAFVVSYWTRSIVMAAALGGLALATPIVVGAAVKAVAGGAAWFDPAVAPRVLEHYRLRVAPSGREATRLELLTDRERDVLRLMARGATNQEIGQALFVAEATVKTHIGSIFGKLGVRDRAAAIVFAYDHGVVVPGGPRPG